jgi:hypothetical protein
MNENITGNNNVHTPAEPAVLNDPLRNRGVAQWQPSQPTD